MSPSIPRKCSCTRCMARVVSNATKAEKVLTEVRRHVSAWAGVEITGSGFQYVPQRPAWLAPDERFPHFKIVLHVEFNATDVVFQCDSGGPTKLFVSLGESADRDIVAWIHNEVVNSWVAASV